MSTLFLQKSKNLFEGQKIRTLREDYLHMSKSQFADKIGISFGQLTRLEEGQTIANEDLIRRIVKEYGISELWLYGNAETPWNDPLPLDSVGSRLRTVYLNSGLSQRAFCKRIGSSTSSLTNIMEGRQQMTVKYAQRIEKVFDVGADWLLYGDERNKEFPCGEEMVEYLKGDIEMRKIVWEKMKSQTAEE